MIFKYENYVKFLSELRKLGQTQLFRDWDGENTFLLRHDVDLSISLAHQLAGIEAETNTSSTFFIMTTCHFYNIQSKNNRQLLTEIIEMKTLNPTWGGQRISDELKKIADAASL